MRAAQTWNGPASRGEEAASLDLRDPAAVYRAHVQQVGAWVRRLAGPGADVEDLIHEVFIVALKRLADFDPTRAAFSTWLYAIAIRVVQARRRRDAVRRRILDWFKRAEPSLPPAQGPPTLGPGEALERARSHRLLYELLDELPETYRTTLVLFEIEEQSCEQIARLTGISLQNVWVRVHRGRQKLREALRARGLGEGDAHGR